MTFRVQLYAGRKALPAAGLYVAPGEAAAMALPVPRKQGSFFDGWVDADGNRVTEETVVTADGDIVLTALWKQWTLAVANWDRPQVAHRLLSLQVQTQLQNQAKAYRRRKQNLGLAIYTALFIKVITKLKSLRTV